ncbi:MAG: hypothetical protein OEZ68_10770 [Gammaproteobacteria bacterium]|nr:hypothetical protein [Gammaproteobacteria bacterium]MDH5801275.1 hypothetical protein [Gammaproteobacteria bacterium]
MKYISIIFLLFTLSACAPAHRLGTVVIENNTGERIFAQTRFMHDNSLSSFYSLQPNAGTEIATFDIAPGTEADVLVQLEEMQITKSGCDVNLDKSHIKKMAQLEKPGYFIRITKDVFNRCKKTNSTWEIYSISG